MKIEYPKLSPGFWETGTMLDRIRDGFAEPVYARNQNGRRYVIMRCYGSGTSPESPAYVNARACKHTPDLLSLVGSMLAELDDLREPPDTGEGYATLVLMDRAVHLLRKAGCIVDGIGLPPETDDEVVARNRALDPGQEERES